MKTKGPTWQPKTDDFRQVFVEQNPWHATGQVPEALAKSVERPLAQQFWSRLQTNKPPRYQMILGPRRVGKSTVLYQTVRRLITAGVPAKRLWWLRLDHPLLMQMPLGELAKLVLEGSKARTDAPVFLFCDELAYADKWDLWLKTFYDEKWPIQVAGSSSSTAALRERRLESGVGRWEEQYLAPYLFTEYLALIGRETRLPSAATLDEALAKCAREGLPAEDLEASRRRFLLTGGFPELLIGTELSQADEATALLQSQRVLRTDAVERAIYKDIPQAFTVADPMLLERMLYVLAGQVAGVLSPQKLCQQLGGMSQPTFDKYLSYLERAFLVFTLPNYSGTEISVQRRGRKLYFVDGAVRNAALQRGVAPLSDQMEMGLLVENLVAGHLHALSQQTQVRLYHWREKDHEVDLIYDHPDRPLAFEIGLSARHSKEGLYQFAKVYPRFQGRCYMVAPNAQVSHPDQNWDKVGTFPLDMLLAVLGRQAAAALAERLTGATPSGSGKP